MGLSIDELYNRAFYQENLDNKVQYDGLGDAIAAALRLADRPNRYFRFLEVGCGCGLTLARLFTQHHQSVLGIDGSTHAVAMVPEEIAPFVTQVNIADYMPGRDRANFAVCVEVAEHLPSQLADHLVDIMTRAAEQRIIWSAAPPGQGGVDHSNEQPPQYWLGRFAVRGWEPEMEQTITLRQEMIARRAQHYRASASFYVLKPA